MPPRSRKLAGPTPIDSVQHKDKRTNLPTADAQQLVTPEVEQARQIVVARDATLDPQLVWRGKFPGDDLANAQRSQPVQPRYRPCRSGALCCCACCFC